MAEPFLTGKLLIAMPGIGDPRFERAVIFLCAHDVSHAMGIVVNRPVDGLSVIDVLQQLDVKAAAEPAQELVLMGGPVERERGFVLHTDDYACGEATVRVTDGFSLTATREVLTAMTQEAGPPRRAVLALGYAGWGEGQLEQEIRDNVWLVCDADAELVFGDNHEFKWSMALAKIGITADHLSGIAGSA